MTGPVCPLKSKFSHLPRTLTLALPLCPATSSSPLTSQLFAASFLSLSCCVPGPGLLSFSDLSHLHADTTLVLAGARGEAARSTARRFLSVPPGHAQPAAAAGCCAPRAGLLTLGAPQ